MEFGMEAEGGCNSEMNLRFYKNDIQSEPDGDYIENILNTWKGDYDKLEKNIGYIQWLFPNYEAGKNPCATPLNKVEAELIREDPVLKGRVCRAFEMMLDYFGMEHLDNKFHLAPNHSERMKHLNVWGSGSFLYISRILRSLKELGYEDLMFPWMKFLAQLIYQDKKLDKAEDSFEEYWMPILNRLDYEEIVVIVDEFKK